MYTDGYDGHNLRAFSYFSDKMPDIQIQMDQLKIKQRFFKITHDNGKVEYVSENQLNARGIEIPD